MQKEFLFTDPPVTACAPQNIDIVVSSDDRALFGSILLSGGKKEERCPTALLLHGFPGHEKNLDLAQALRRTGMHVAFFSYRGAWGSEGDYAVSHLKDDANAVLRFLFSHACEYRIDTDKLWLIGHSLGGFTALHTLSEPCVPLCGGVLIAPCDLGMMYLSQRERYYDLVAPEDKPGGCLHIAYEGVLRDEAARKAEQWQFSAISDRLRPYPMLFIGGSADTVTPPEAHIKPLLARLNGKTQYIELNDGHAFAASRVALAEAVAEFLGSQTERR